MLAQQVRYPQLNPISLGSPSFEIPLPPETAMEIDAAITINNNTSNNSIAEEPVVQGDSNAAIQPSTQRMSPQTGFSSVIIASSSQATQQPQSPPSQPQQFGHRQQQ